MKNENSRDISQPDLDKKPAKKDQRTCPNGHTYYKSSDCPVCPICEQNAKPENSFLGQLSAPARRALQNNGLTTLEALAKTTESAVLKLHGMGPGSIPKLRKALEEAGLTFRKN